MIYALSYVLKIATLVIVACFFGTMAHASGINPEQQSITISLSTEPPSLDSSLSEDVVSAFVLSAINEGLVRSERNSKIIPGVAEKWRVDGSQAYFWLRKDAKWSDGSVVTAHDFVYSWRRLFDPKTGASVPRSLLMYLRMAWKS